ncbi:hypothetical protein WR25_09653 [Diploscapter pachys]|uniref:Spindle assembly abnormal protein 6 N-terminal domain-containing protein n=1 Tax=Diploscapter pachys TaxID=2018661 RepID=A0A2A2J5D4_9BILA|nr:hypothetical protein WR25_09653 [Diploscapter pachys]
MSHSILASVASPSQILYNHPVDVNLVQRTNTGDSISNKIQVNLRILNRRSETAEKEFRFELSRADEYDFLYADNITRDKFQALAKECQLSVDFDQFPQTVVDEILKKSERREPRVREPEEFHANGESTIQFNCYLSADRSICEFESVNNTRLHRQRIAIALQAVRGEELLSHVIAIAKNRDMKLKKYKQDSEQLNLKARKLTSEHERDEAKIEELTQELNELRADYDNLQTSHQDAQSDLELAREELSNFREGKEEAEQQLRDLEDELANVESDLQRKGVELDELQILYESEQVNADNWKQKHAELSKDFDKLKYIVSTYHKDCPKPEFVKSLDHKKLAELDNELKEKAQLFEDMQAQVAALKNQIETLNAEIVQKDKQIVQLQRDKDEAVRSLLVYQTRFPMVSSATASPLYYTPPQQVITNRFMAAGNAPVPFPPIRSSTPPTPSYSYRPVLGQGNANLLGSGQRMPLSNLTANQMARTIPKQTQNTPIQEGSVLHSLQPENAKNVT